MNTLRATFTPETEVPEVEIVEVVISAGDLAVGASVEGSYGEAEASAESDFDERGELQESADPDAHERLLTPVQEAEFTRMYTEHYGFLVRVARKAGVHEDNVEDLLQEVFLKAARAGKIFDPETNDNERGYLARIAQRQIINDYRHTKRKSEPPVVTDQEANDLGLQLTAQTGPSVEDLALSEDTMNMLREWQAILPSEYFSVLYLIAYEDKPYQECANILGVPLGTVMSRLHRARKQIRAYEQHKHDQDLVA